ncbi:MAG: DUF6076 domain-containing protein [Angelakisella sp.]
MSSLFKIYLTDGQEFFVTQRDDQQEKTTFPLFQSMLDLIYLDIDSLSPVFEELGRVLPKLYSTKDDRLAERVTELLGELAKAHIYFEFVRIDWLDRMNEIRQNNYIGIVELLPYKKKLSQMPDTLREIQEQLQSMLTLVLDINSSDKLSIPEKMVQYYADRERSGKAGFRFEPQSTCYEVIDQKTFTEVIYPTSIYSIIDFLVRECIKCEQRFRICKNCHRYFALTGYSNAEYCDRAYDEQGHTCKEMGALNVWQKKAKQPAYELYSKEYKKRFARIKYGKISKVDFYAWAEEARTYRDRCMANDMAYDDFKHWLDQSDRPAATAATAAAAESEAP